mmetsp:Transcript_28329/g.59757  ORF Transcript_28329/g.59757 Transcript_28329/m.59757 type:complete len:106 (+) Transcript_28329:658-975(+)
MVIPREDEEEDVIAFLSRISSYTSSQDAFTSLYSRIQESLDILHKTQNTTQLHFTSALLLSLGWNALEWFALSSPLLLSSALLWLCSCVLWFGKKRKKGGEGVMW